MDSKVARSVSQHVASNFKAVEALNEYAEYRLNKLRSLLEIETDPTKMYQLQGSISEIKLMSKLREHSQAVVERDRNG